MFFRYKAHPLLKPSSPIDFSSEKELAAVEKNFEILLFLPFLLRLPLFLLFLLVLNTAIFFGVFLCIHFGELVAVDIFCLSGGWR